MKKHVIIAIRYSIVQKNNKSWRATEANFEDYCAKILGSERLDVREATFENITLASICNQNSVPENVAYSVLIMTADVLPKERLSNLENMIHRANKNGINFHIAKIDSGQDYHYDYKNINEAIKDRINKELDEDKQSVIATVRLDDDDGLSENFIFKLSQHMKPELGGYALSFAYGLEGYWDTATEVIKDIRHCYFPKNAFGLSYINGYHPNSGLTEKKSVHVYNLGNHMKIDETYSTIVEASEPMYFRTLSNTNDSVGSPYHRHLPLVEGKNTLVNFSYLSKLYPEFEAMPALENVADLEVCKSSSPWNVLITHLNNRIQLREKQIRELTSRLNGETS